MTMIDFDLLMSVDPQAIERTRRLEHAILMLRAGVGRDEVSRSVRAKFSVSRVTAWRTTSMALDLVATE